MTFDIQCYYFAKVKKELCFARSYTYLYKEYQSEASLIVCISA